MSLLAKFAVIAAAGTLGLLLGHPRIGTFVGVLCIQLPRLLETHTGRY